MRRDRANELLARATLTAGTIGALLMAGCAPSVQLQSAPTPQEPWFADMPAPGATQEVATPPPAELYEPWPGVESVPGPATELASVGSGTLTITPEEAVASPPPSLSIPSVSDLLGGRELAPPAAPYEIDPPASAPRQVVRAPRQSAPRTPSAASPESVVRARALLERASNQLVQKQFGNAAASYAVAAGVSQTHDQAVAGLQRTLRLANDTAAASIEAGRPEDAHAQLSAVRRAVPDRIGQLATERARADQLIRQAEVRIASRIAAGAPPPAPERVVREAPRRIERESPRRVRPQAKAVTASRPAQAPDAPPVTVRLPAPALPPVPQLPSVDDPRVVASDVVRGGDLLADGRSALARQDFEGAARAYAGAARIGVTRRAALDGLRYTVASTNVAARAWMQAGGTDEASDLLRAVRDRVPPGEPALAESRAETAALLRALEPAPPPPRRRVNTTPAWYADGGSALPPDVQRGRALLDRAAKQLSQAQYANAASTYGQAAGVEATRPQALAGLERTLSIVNQTARSWAAEGRVDEARAVLSAVQARIPPGATELTIAASQNAALLRSL